MQQQEQEEEGGGVLEMGWNEGRGRGENGMEATCGGRKEEMGGGGQAKKE